MMSSKEAFKDFPAAVFEQASAAKRIRTTSFLPRRLDLRGKTAFTLIENPKEIAECAYSVYRNSTGWQLSIHVTDVCEYVCEGSPLDEEAKKRCATIIGCGEQDRQMLPDSIIDLCDLKQSVDKLAISIMIDIDRNGNITDLVCEESVIRPAGNCIFSEVDQLQTAADTSSVMLLRTKYAPFKTMLEDMYELAATVCQQRFDRKGLDCAYYRRVYEKDEQGKITSFRRELEPDTRAMLREIGYFAAVAVGEKMHSMGMPCVYNGRGAVDESALNYLSELVGADSINSNPAARAADIAELAKGTPYYDFVCDILAFNVPHAEYSHFPVFNSFCGTDKVVSFFHPASQYKDLLIQRNFRTAVAAKSPKNLNLNRQKKAVAEAAAQATAVCAEVDALSRKHSNDCAYEYIRNNSSAEFTGFPLLLNPHGEVIVMLDAGTLAYVPKELSADYCFIPARSQQFTVLSAENGRITLKPIL